MLAGGEERTLTRADGDLLRAARVGLGTLGAVVAVTLRCVPAFSLRGVDGPEPLADVLADLQERADRHAHFEFWTFPHSPLALTRTNTPTDAPPEPPSRAREWVGEVLVDNGAFELAVPPRAPLPGRHPRAQPLRRRRGDAPRARRSLPPRLRQPAARALHGDGVRDPAGPRGGGRAGGEGDPRAPPGLLPARAALRRRGRRIPLAHLRARQRLRGRPRLRRHAVGGAVPGGRDAAERLGRATALGQALVPGARPSWRRATRAGARGRPRGRSSTPTACSRTGGRSGCSGRCVRPRRQRRPEPRQGPESSSNGANMCSRR